MLVSDIDKEIRLELIVRTNKALADIRDEMGIPVDEFLWMVIGYLISSAKQVCGWETTRRSIERSLQEIEKYEDERARKQLN